MRAGFEFAWFGTEERPPGLGSSLAGLWPTKSAPDIGHRVLAGLARPQVLLAECITGPQFVLQTRTSDGSRASGAGFRSDRDVTPRGRFLRGQRR